MKNSEMRKSTVTVIIPAFNASKFIANCLDSVVGQTRQPQQIIVVDDGSTDHTAEFVSKLFGASVEVIKQNNSGPATARNTGLRIANGDYVAFLDADDYWLPKFIELCADFLDKNENAVAVSTGSIFKLVGNRIIQFPDDLGEDIKIHQKPELLDNFFSFWGKYNHVLTGTVMIRRSVIETAGYMLDDLAFHEDLEYWGYIATFGPWGFIPEPLWVCDSEQNAIRIGWHKKYKDRRLKAHNVARWEHRIYPRLHTEHNEGFEMMRGRIAIDIARNYLLIGYQDKAFDIINHYGKHFPVSPTSWLLLRASKYGPWIKKPIKHIVRIREWQNATSKKIKYEYRRFVNKKDTPDDILSHGEEYEISAMKKVYNQKIGFFQEILYIPVIVPSYHAIFKEKKYPHYGNYWRRLGDFERDIELFSKWFDFIRPEDLVNKLSNKEIIPSRSCLLTIDDGFRGTYETAGPILRRKGIPVIFFINNSSLSNDRLLFPHLQNVVAYTLANINTKAGNNHGDIRALLEKKGAWQKDIICSVKALKNDSYEFLNDIAYAIGIDSKAYCKEYRPYLSEDHVRNIIKDGFYVGSHGIDHSSLQSLQDGAQIEHIKKSMSELNSKFGLPYRFFAFPYNDIGIKKHVYDHLFDNRIVDVAFGNSMMRSDYHPRIIQRLSFENKTLPGTEILARAFAKRTILKIIGCESMRRK